MKKFTSLFLALMMTVGLVSGCGSTGNDAPASAAPATSESAAPAASEAAKPAESSAPAESAAPAGEVKYKEDIIIGMSGKIISIDPQTESNTQHNYMFRMVFDTPLDFNNQTLELEPNIATEWSSNEDATIYTLKLRDDVYFHNGEKMTAHDFVFTYDRAPSTNSSSTLGNMIEYTKAVDDYTVEIKLHKANVDFPYLLTLPTSSIINEKACMEDELEGPGVGTGPFKIDSYEFGSYFKVVRNEEFWGEVTPTKSINLRYIPENSPRLIALETGEIDVCQDPDTLELAHIEDTPGLELQSYMGSSITYVAMNYKAGPFTNQDFRLAVCYGIDAEEIMDVVRDGRAEKCLSLWGWNEYGYNGGKTSYEYNPELAKEYLAKAYPNGGASFKLSISSGDRKAIGELMQAQLKEIGIEVELVEFDTAGLSKSTTAGEHDACIYGCGMNIFGDDIRRLICPGTGVNKSHYDHERVNELMDLAVAETDDATRKAYYEEVQQICFEDGAYMPIYFSEGFFGVKEGVSGIDYYPTSHHDFSEIVMIEK